MNDTTHRYPVHPWSLEEDALQADQLTLSETLFSLANGYIGTRGTFEEGLADNPTSQEGTYLNGVYAREPIFYEEVAHAFASHNNKMVQAPDGKAMRLFIDGEAFIPSSTCAQSHHRALDFKRGVVERRTVWRLDDHRQLEIHTKRLVSLADPHVIVLEYSVTPIGFSGEIKLESLLGIGHLPTHDKDANDPRAGHLSAADSLTQLALTSENNRLAYVHEVKGSGFIIGSACVHHCSHGQGEVHVADDADTSSAMFFAANLSDGEPLRLTKYIAYHHAVSGEEAAVQVALHASLNDAQVIGMDFLEAAQTQILEQFWEGADVVIDGDDALQQGFRFNLLHIYLSSGKDGRSSIGAKGLTGPGYDGHYFWDTELYIIPFFVYTAPGIARKLLEYRYSILDAARTRAREMSHMHGALYAWRTIGGEECSAYFPAGTAQYHINADIAYAIIQYFNATQDWHFMRLYGVEMLLEMARIWIDIGHFCDRKGGAFCIHGVTGPDEYTAMIDNNFYTNAMAQHHLRAAVNMLDALASTYPDDAARIAKQIRLADDEPDAWAEAAKRMYLPKDEAMGIHPQDDTFLNKPHWDFEGTPKEHYPLLLHYHPLVIYRHQVLKQADVVLAMALLGHQFDRDVRRASLDYYEPLTTHDSTLSTCTYSVECSRLGLHDKAYALFGDNVRMDIDNLHHNTEYGLHTACMAGSWMSVVMGFGGLEVYDDTLHFAPYLPAHWTGLAFKVQFHGQRVKVEVGSNGTRYTLEGDDALTLFHHGQSVTLGAGESQEMVNPVSETLAAG